MRRRCLFDALARADVLILLCDDRKTRVRSRATTADPNDPHNFRRFVDAQSRDYADALSELRAGEKRSHWMWYVFPQYEGLGRSPTAREYAIRSVSEADAYLRHPILRPRLLECAEALLAVENRSAHDILGAPDDAKLGSSATLFSLVSPAGSVFHRILERYFAGESDRRTLELIRMAEGSSESTSGEP